MNFFNTIMIFLEIFCVDHIFFYLEKNSEIFKAKIKRIKTGLICSLVQFRTFVIKLNT